MRIIALILCSIIIPMSFAATNDKVAFQVIQDEFALNQMNVESATLVSQNISADVYGVNIRLTLAAAVKLAELTNANIGKQAEFLVNNKIVSISTLQGKLGQEFMISGLNKEDALQFIQQLSLKK